MGTMRGELVAGASLLFRLVSDQMRIRQRVVSLGALKRRALNNSAAAPACLLDRVAIARRTGERAAVQQASEKQICGQIKRRRQHDDGIRVRASRNHLARQV